MNNKKMSEDEYPPHNRLTAEEYAIFLKDCRKNARTPLHYDFVKSFLNFYISVRGINHEMNPIYMRSRDETMADAERYCIIFIRKYATVIDDAFHVCENKRLGYFHLSETTVEAILLRLVEELKSEKNFINEAAYGFQFSLFFLQSGIPVEVREKVGELLIKFKYNDIFNNVVKIGTFKPQDAFECNNVYALNIITFAVIRQYSIISKSFSLYLADVGVLTTLTAQITETDNLNCLHDTVLSKIMDIVLEIIHHIAYHSGCKPKQNFDATKTALMNFPRGDSNTRDFVISMSLVYAMDEHELGSLPDESNLINMMIKFMQKALIERFREDVFNLCQLADGLSKLTTKRSNNSKIVHTKGALSALVNMLRYENVKENASAVQCIHALARESTVRSTILDFPGLVPAMDDLRKTTSVNLRNVIDDVLEILRSCSPVAGAVTGSSLIADTSKHTQDIAKPTQEIANPIQDITKPTQDIANPIQDITKLTKEIAKPIQNIAKLTGDIVKPIQDIAIRDKSIIPAAMKQLVDGVSQLTNFFPSKDQKLPPIIVNVYHSDNSTNVTNVVKQEEKFTARGKSILLRPEDEQKIRRHWTMLIEEIDATHIIMDLISRGVFDVDDKREILGPEARKKRTEIMLQKLLNAGPGSAYQNFIEVLEKNHAHVVDELRKWVHN